MPRAKQDYFITYQGRIVATVANQGDVETAIRQAMTTGFPEPSLSDEKTPKPTPKDFGLIIGRKVALEVESVVVRLAKPKRAKKAKKAAATPPAASASAPPAA